jgi:hypothetical protein
VKTKLTALVLAVIAASGMTASGALIDDFGDADLSEYTFYKRLDQGAGTTNISFSSPSGTITATSSGTTGAEQVLLFRSDVSFDVGQEIRIDGPSTESGTSTEDLGLAVGQTPASLGNPQAGDNRNTADFLFISYRNPTQLNSRGFNGNAEVGQVQNFGVNADMLFIARPATDGIELGWYDGSTRNVSRSLTVNPSIFTNIGFYADLRADGASIGSLDNLSIIPEPTSVLLGLLAMVGMVSLRRRQS